MDEVKTIILFAHEDQNKLFRVYIESRRSWAAG
jgi:hypothetical protein